MFQRVYGEEFGADLGFSSSKKRKIILLNKKKFSFDNAFVREWEMNNYYEIFDIKY